MADRVRGRNLVRPLMRPLFVAASLGLAVHLLLPQVSGLRATYRALVTAVWWVPLTAVALEAASLASYGMLVQRLLRRGGIDAGTGFVQRAVLVGNSVGRALPGGSGAALAVQLDGFHRAGVDVVVAGTASWTAGLLSTGVLMALLPLGGVAALLVGRLAHVALSVLVAVVIAPVAVTLLLVALRDPAAVGGRVRELVRFAARGPLRSRLDPDVIADGVRRGATTVRDLAADPAALRAALTWAAANWLLDVAVVVLLAMTIGRGTPLTGIVVAYVTAQVVASVPLTPGGVGLVESTMVAMLVATGAPGAAATATVLGWRLVSHWLPIPVGLALWPTLGGGRDRETLPEIGG